MGLSGPRSRSKVEIKIPDPAGNRIRPLGWKAVTLPTMHEGELILIFIVSYFVIVINLKLSTSDVEIYD